MKMTAQVTVVNVVMAVGPTRRTVRVEFLPLDGLYFVDVDCPCPKGRACSHLLLARHTLGTVYRQLSGPRGGFQPPGQGSKPRSARSLPGPLARTSEGSQPDTHTEGISDE